MIEEKPDFISAKPNVTDNQLKQEVGRNEGQGIGQMNNSQANYVKIENFYQNGKVNYPNSPLAEVSQQKKLIPSLLPYLANRSSQEYELRKTIETHLEQQPNKPVICIFYGDEHQCHEKFLERIKEKYLPQMLGLDATNNTVKKHFLPYPSGATNLEEFSERLCHQLGEEVAPNNSPSTAEINRIFSGYPCPIIIETHLLAEDFKDEEINPLNNLLDFWNSWPELALNRQLIICLSIKYKPLKDRSKRWLWLFKVLDWLKIQKLPEYYRHLQYNEMMQQKLNEISQSKFARFEKLNGVVLPELSGICRRDVENWAHTKNTKEFIGEEMLQQLIIYIRGIFEQYGDTISMEDLANRLREILEELTSEPYLV